MPDQKLTARDAQEYLRRFPAQGALQVAFNLGMVLIGNAVVLWLLASGDLRGAHLIVLVMVETILLIAFSWLLQRAVPRVDWSEQPKPWRQTLPLIAFVLVWFAGAYGITLLIIGGYPDVVSLFSSPQAWMESRLYLPILYTLAMALMHGLGDLHHYRRHGGPFLSSVSHDAMARYLTLLLGGIPFAMPFFAVTIGGIKGIEYVVRNARLNARKSVLAGMAMLAVGTIGFQVVDFLIASGVRAWAIGFVFAKLIAESMIACIPLVMSHVAKEGNQKPVRGDTR